MNILYLKDVVSVNIEFEDIIDTINVDQFKRDNEENPEEDGYIGQGELDEEGENIDRALKRFKRKFDKTGGMRQLRSRKQFVKPSVKHRQKIQKAQYIQHLRDSENI